MFLDSYMVADIAGLMAGFFASIALVPQVIKCWKTKETKALSYNMMLLSFLGNMCWLINGIIYVHPGLILSSCFILPLVLFLFFLKIKSENFLKKQSIHR